MDCLLLGHPVSELPRRIPGDGLFSSAAYERNFALVHTCARGGLPAAATQGPRPGPLGVLHTPGLARSPSQPESLRFLAARAAMRGRQVRFLTRDEILVLDDVAALFIRDETTPGNHTPAFAARAEALGIPVVDSSLSIAICGDKALQGELFAAMGLPCPTTRLLHADNVDAVVADLGFPFVLKQTDGAWSFAVWRIDSAEELAARLPALLHNRLFVVAQRWTPSPFDWRVAVLDGELLFAARYHMVPSHWQVAQWQGDRVVACGRTEGVPLRALPPEIAALALRATSRLGRGFFGVDLKETVSGPVLIEVNENTDIDVNQEDGAEGAAVWERLLDTLLGPAPADAVHDFTAREADVPALAAASAMTFGTEALSRRGFLAPMRAGTAVVVGLRSDAGIVGHAQVHLHRRTLRAYVNEVLVSAELRGRGFGEALMVAAERAARAAGMRTLTAHVRAGNARSLGIMLRSGLSIVARLPGWYSGPEDALYLRKRLH